MKSGKYRFPLTVALVLSACLTAAPLYSAVKKVQMNIPGCAS